LHVRFFFLLLLPSFLSFFSFFFSSLFFFPQTSTATEPAATEEVPEPSKDEEPKAEINAEDEQVQDLFGTRYDHSPSLTLSFPSGGSCRCCRRCSR